MTDPAFNLAQLERRPNWYDHLDSVEEVDPSSFPSPIAATAVPSTYPLVPPTAWASRSMASPMFKSVIE